MNWERWGVWVNDMDVMPRGYGIAWYVPGAARGFCLRVPFNRIVGAFRAWYLGWRRPCADDPIARAYALGHATGWMKGEEHGAQTTHRLYAAILQGWVAPRG